MSHSAFLSSPPSNSVLDRRSGAAKNRLLNLAFEDGSRSHYDADDPEEPKSVPADVFKQGCVAKFSCCILYTPQQIVTIIHSYMIPAGSFSPHGRKHTTKPLRVYVINMLTMFPLKQLECMMVVLSRQTNLPLSPPAEFESMRS